MRVGWDRKCVSVGMIGVVGDGEKSLVRVNNGVKGKMVWDIVKWMENVVCGKEWGVCVNGRRKRSVRNG